MIRSHKALATMLSRDPSLRIMKDVPLKGARLPVWALTPGGGRIHGNAAKAALRRGFPLASADLFDGGSV